MKKYIALVAMVFFAQSVSAQLIVQQIPDPTIHKYTNQEIVEYAFPDVPDMIPTIQCESKFRQIVDGKPLMSPTSDAGIMQINQIHWKQASSLGLDIFYSIDDNVKMGRIIYDSEGIKAWTCSKLI